MEATFAETLRRLRSENGLTQQELSDKLYVDRSTISKWESGDRMPDAVTLARLSECLGVDLSMLQRFSEAGGEKPNVMIVDDEKIILNGGIPVLQRVLPKAEIHGFTVPSEAIAFAKEHRVALAFLDIEMGRINGMDVCRALMELNRQINVVFLTAYKEYSFEAWETGASGFLLKPLSEEAIRGILPRLRWPVRGLEAV